MKDEPVGQLGPITGHKGDVTVTLTNLSYRETKKGRRYPYPDFGNEFIGPFHKAFLTPRRRGLLRSTLVCPWCEASLEGISLTPVSVRAEVALKPIPPIQVQLDMPGIRCPGCSRSLIRIDDRDVASDVSFALMDAFEGASITPG